MDSQNEYFSRIQNVVKFVHNNLSENLDLNTLAKAAYFSPFHFHRIFSSIVKETPLDFVKRIRLEKAANILISNRNVSITEIAFSCGFSSSSVFSRAFKNHFGCSASDWKKDTSNSKNCKTNSKHGKEQTPGKNYFDRVKNNFYQNRRSINMNVEVKNMPAFNVAYAANLEGYIVDKIRNTWLKLTQWAGSRNLINQDTKFIGIGFDNPDITPKDKCRYYACLTISNNVEASNGIGKMEIKGGEHAVYHFNGPLDQIENTYKELYGSWLLNSSFQPTDEPCYEIYYKDPEEEPKGICEMDICIPLQPL